MTASYPDYNVVVADVISEAVSNWEEVILINRGEKDGIKPDMVVGLLDMLNLSLQILQR